jgi:pentatricopeptide repeat protein
MECEGCNPMIVGYVSNGCYEEVLEAFSMMKLGV